MVLAWFVLVSCLALIPASIAAGKGRSFVGWYIYGWLLFIVAFIHALAIRPTREAIEGRAIEAGNLKCPHCAEFIRREAKVCRFCGRDVEPPPRTPYNEQPIVAAPGRPDTSNYMG